MYKVQQALVISVLVRCCFFQSAPSPTLGWLVEEGGNLMQARISINQIVEVNFILDLTELKISEAFANLGYIGQRWKTLENVKQNGLTDRLVVGLENFRLSSEYLQYMYSFKGTDKSHINSDCIFFERVLDEKDLATSARLKTSFDTLASATQEVLENFANTFDFVSNYWEQVCEQSLYEIDSLRQGTFPLTFRGRIESSKCLSDITYEEITVLRCESGDKFFACYVSYRYPVGINNYVKLEAVGKGDELPIILLLTGSSGPARVWGHVKSSVLIVLR